MFSLFELYLWSFCSHLDFSFTNAQLFCFVYLCLSPSPLWSDQPSREPVPLLYNILVFVCHGGIVLYPMNYVLLWR